MWKKEKESIKKSATVFLKAKYLHYPLNQTQNNQSIQSNQKDQVIIIKLFHQNQII